MGNLSDVLQGFSSIPLPGMKRVALMDRIDTKFIFHKRDLDAILGTLRTQYQLLEIGTQRLSTYRNLYFDTPNFQFYTDHHNGKGNRMKIRKRNYEDTDTCYIEVKRKANTGRTSKDRTIVPLFEPGFSIQAQDFLKDFYAGFESLRPVLWNRFERMTLVNLEREERITIDLDLESSLGGRSRIWEHLAIAEVKQAGMTRESPFFKVLKDRRIHPYPISKYCMGMATLYPDLKQNTFKEKLLRIHKLNHIHDLF